MIIKIFPSQCELPFSYREGGKLKNFSVAFLYSWGRSSLEVYGRERRVVWERGHPGVTHFISQFGPLWGQAPLLSAIQSPETLHYYWDTGSIYGCLIYPWHAVRVLTSPDTIIFPFGPPSFSFWAFQVAIEVKNLSANAGDVRDVGSIPGSGRSLKEGMATHSSVLVWRIPKNRGAWRATVHGIAKLDTTEVT